MYLSSPPTQSERPDLLEASARAKPPPNRNMMPHGNLNTLDIPRQRVVTQTEHKLYLFFSFINSKKFLLLLCTSLSAAR
jgi:hypothetical protein